MSRRIGGGRLNERRLLCYILLTVGIGLVAWVDYLIYDSLYGGLAVSISLILLTTIVPASVFQFLFDKRNMRKIRNVAYPMARSYSVGTFGMILSDLLRTFSGAVNVSPQIIGANQWEDGVFLDGIILAISYYAISLGYTAWQDRRSNRRQIRWI